MSTLPTAKPTPKEKEFLRYFHELGRQRKRDGKGPKSYFRHAEQLLLFGAQCEYAYKEGYDSATSEEQPAGPPVENKGTCEGCGATAVPIWGALARGEWVGLCRKCAS